MENVRRTFMGALNEAELISFRLELGHVANLLFLVHFFNPPIE